MRTVEAALGLVIIVAALALALGAARLLAPVPPAGLGVTLALIGWGATLAAHGMAGRAITKRNPSTAHSWRAVFYLLLALTLAATMPLVVDLLNLATVAGFPSVSTWPRRACSSSWRSWLFAPPHISTLSAAPPPRRNRARITECWTGPDCSCRR